MLLKKNCSSDSVNRRKFLTLASVVGGATLAGCAGSDVDEKENNPSTDSDTTSKRTTENRSKNVIADGEHVYDEKRFPIDASKGDTISIEAEVEEGGPMILVAYPKDDAETKIIDEQIDTEGTFKGTVKRNFTHYASAMIANGNGRVTVVHKTTG